MKRSLVGFFRNEDGVTAVECALMLALVVVVCLIALAPGGESLPAGAVVLE